MAFVLLIPDQNECVTGDQGAVFATKESVIEAICELLSEGDYDVDDFEVLEVREKFAFAPPTDKGQLIRKD